MKTEILFFRSMLENAECYVVNAKLTDRNECDMQMRNDDD